MAAPTQKVSLKTDMSSRPKNALDEKCYILRPLTIPPARQMFYQMCEIMLPEIQEMISRLPRNTDHLTCDSKEGWLSKSFIEKCREIVNKYVLEAVQKELLEDEKVVKEKVHSKEKEPKKTGSSLDYCNQMLSNIKKGIYKTVELKPVGLVHSRSESMDVGGSSKETDIQSDDEDEEYTIGEIIQSSIPEKMDHGDTEDDSDDNEVEIDIEAVEEINKMIAHSQMDK